MTERLGIIGGSGLYDMGGLSKRKSITVLTPFGKPSGPLRVGEFSGCPVVFLARHGQGHCLLPSEINYRANIYALKKLGVTKILAASAVGSLREEIHPRDFVIPDQFVDRTTRREGTFFGNGIAAHVSFADPFCKSLRQALIKICKALGLRVHEKGTYINMEGPAFSTRAESELYRQWGMDIIGMTNLVEAKLAREAEICYATMAMVTDYDCWHEHHEAVTVEGVLENLIANAGNARNVIKEFIRAMPQICETGCRRALSKAIITDPKKMPARIKRKLRLLIGKYI